MFHRQSRNRIAKKPAHARSMERNLVTSLILYETIRLPVNRARVVQPILDSLIAKAKRDEAHQAIRYINAVVTDKNASRKIMQVLVERYKGRTSGFSRIIPAGARKGDGASLVDLELMDMQTASEVVEKPVKKAAKKTTKKEAASSSKQ